MGMQRSRRRRQGPWRNPKRRREIARLNKCTNLVKDIGLSNNPKQRREIARLNKCTNLVKDIERGTGRSFISKSSLTTNSTGVGAWGFPANVPDDKGGRKCESY